MTFLPDANVWLALASRRHAMAERGAAWVAAVEAGPIGFCRITQIGLLRLLTNRAVMGSEVLNQTEAWRVYDRICTDSRILFLPEPDGVGHVWRRLSSGRFAAANQWTDAYLLAFARRLEATLVTFDRAIARAAGAGALLVQ